MECEVKLKVPFHDLDPLNVVWHGNYLKYFDVARGELFSRSGIDLFEYSQKKHYVFPVIRSSIKHLHPLRYADEFICKATLKEAAVKIAMDFEIRLATDGRLSATGSGEQCALNTDDMEMELAIPQDIQDALWGIR